jgi:hypothetical protein
LGNWVNKEALANPARAFSYSGLLLFFLELDVQRTSLLPEILITGRTKSKYTATGNRGASDTSVQAFGEGCYTDPHKTPQ